MQSALSAIRKQKLSVRNTESLVKKMSGAGKKEEKESDEDPYVRSLADELKRAMSTQVRIVYNNGRAESRSITIPPTSSKDLQQSFSRTNKRILKRA